MKLIFSLFALSAIALFGAEPAALIKGTGPGWRAMTEADLRAFGTTLRRVLADEHGDGACLATTRDEAHAARRAPLERKLLELNVQRDLLEAESRKAPPHARSYAERRRRTLREERRRDLDAAAPVLTHVGEPAIPIDDQGRHRRHWILTVHARATSNGLHDGRPRDITEPIRCKHACRLAMRALH